MATDTDHELVSMKKRMWNAVFIKYDINHDGDLTWKEMKPIFDKVFGRIEHEKLMEKLDRNGDGRITKDEFIHAMLPLSVKRAVEMYFYAMDKDDNECLDLEEFEEAMNELGIRNPKLIQNLQRVADSGNNRKISICEFNKFFKKFFNM